MPQCPECGKKYQHHSSLARHRAHHQIKTSTSVPHIQMIFLNYNQDLVDLLTPLLRTRGLALSYLKSKIYQSQDGDVSLFREIYLSNLDPEKWPVRCLDPKLLTFAIRQPNGDWLVDPQGNRIVNIFLDNFINTLLRIISNNFNQIIDHCVGTDSFEKDLDDLYDEWDFNQMYEKAIRLRRINRHKFTKELSGYFQRLYGVLKQENQKIN